MLPLSITEDQVLDALGEFLAVALPGVPVSRGQANRVPEPLGPNFVIVTPMQRLMLSATTHEWRAADDAIDVQRQTRADLQVDLYGPQSTDLAQIMTTLLRDDFAVEQMEGTGVRPLYCDDGRQMPLVNGEAQYEDRWMVRVSLQINPVVSTPAQFADSVRVQIVKAD